MVSDYICELVGEGVNVVELEGIFGLFVVCECGKGFYNVVDKFLKVVVK